MARLTKIADSYKISTDYEDNHAQLFIMIAEANNFLRDNSRHCVTVETNKSVCFYSKPIELSSL